MMKRNYTLIELLTVIFIIAVLAGLIMPATSLVRAKAKRTSCSSNLKQVGALAMQFSNDRDGQIPLYYVKPETSSANPDGSYYKFQKKEIENASRNRLKFTNLPKGDVKDMYTNRKSILWTHALVRYAKYNMNVFFCPADERDLNLFTLPTTGDTDPADNVANDPTRSSYSLAYGYKKISDEDKYSPGGAFKSSTFMKVSQTGRSPAGIFLFGETIAGRLGMNYYENTGNFFKNYYSEDVKDSHRPHSKEFNYSYMDGHVEVLRVTELSILADKGGYLFLSSK